MVLVLGKVKRVMAVGNFGTVFLKAETETPVFNDYIFIKDGGAKPMVSVAIISISKELYNISFQAQYYKCKTRGCKAKGKIDFLHPDTFILTNGEHTHQFTHADIVTVLNHKTNVRGKVKVPAASRVTIYREELAKIPKRLRPLFGEYKQQESALRKLSRKHLVPCQNLTELDEILGQNTQHPEVKHQYGMIDNQRFYRGHFRAGRHEAVLFLNEDAVDRAAMGDTILVDGTFRTRPLECAQVLIIHRLIDGAVSSLGIWRNQKHNRYFFLPASTLRIRFDDFKKNQSLRSNLQIH